MDYDNGTLFLSLTSPVTYVLFSFCLLGVARVLRAVRLA